jgi:hypothetical protein
MTKNIIVDNDFVKEYVTLHTTKKTCEDKMTVLKASKPCGTYVYQGKDLITSCVTISEVTKAVVREGCEAEYNAIEEQIQALKARQELLTVRITSYTQARVKKAPKGLNK